jgi:hypothetical protein
MGVGPIYTNLSLLPRLISEQGKPGQLLGSPELAPVVDRLKQAFPQSISVSGRAKGKPDTIATENQSTIAPGSLKLPYIEPVDRATP